MHNLGGGAGADRTDGAPVINSIYNGWRFEDVWLDR
jgi:hypothetical protein